MSLQRIEPQPGPQRAFLTSKADIAIYGGSAGGGKTWALLLEPLRHVTTNRRFSAVFFRRTTTQITAPGGLWDAASNLYPLIGATPRLGSLEWFWPKGGKVKMAHLEHEQNKQNWQGSEIPLLCFDELTHFTNSQFWYMVSRNRSMSGVKPYVRATCNPDADSWVAEFISWWLDPETGFPISERSGVIRWVIRINDALHWGGTRQELIDKFLGQVPTEALQPKSVTFINAKLTDNKALMAANPEYMANLLAQSTVERERLLHGNWRIRPSAGLYFQRRWVKPIELLPDNIKWCRGWDLAATPKTEQNNPDFTESVLIGTDGKRFIVADHTYMRGSPAEVEAEILRVGRQDEALGRDVLISLPQDPAQAGKAQAARFAQLLAGFRFRCSTETRTTNLNGQPATNVAKSAKVSRFGPFSAQCEAGNVLYVPGPWTEALFDRLEAFPEALHDDAADATSRAFREFLDRLPGQSMLEIAGRHAEGVAAAQKKQEPAPKQYAIGSLEYAMALLGKRPPDDLG